MRIALVTPGFSSDDEDWCIPALQDLATGLSARHDVQVYATCYPRETREYHVKGVAVQSFGNGKTGRLPWLRRQIHAVRALTSDHKSRPCDIVHGFWADGGGVVAAMFRRKHDTPVIVSVMAGELTNEPQVEYGKRDRPIAGRFARFGARRADTVIVNSRFHADRLLAEQLGIEPQIVPLGYDPGRFGPQGPLTSLQGEIPVLCVGSLVPVKGHEILLKSLATALQEVRGLHLHVIGRGDLEADLRNEVDKLGIDHSITIHGHIKHDRLASYYRAASYCVLSSWFESHGMVILEAAGCGRVTIGTDVGSMREFCKAELLVRPGDNAALARNIVTLAKNEQLRRSLSETACNKARNAYTLARSIDATEGLYAQAIAIKGSQ